jgi:hypothetical protein
MIWNQLTYETQTKIVDKIIDLLKEDNDDLTQDGLIAAVNELETWSNSPILSQKD